MLAGEEGGCWWGGEFFYIYNKSWRRDLAGGEVWPKGREIKGVCGEGLRGVVRGKSWGCAAMERAREER